MQLIAHTDARARRATCPPPPSRLFDNRAAVVTGPRRQSERARSAAAAATGAAVAAVGDPQAQDEAEGLVDDALGQLRLAGPPVAELDRELDDPPAGAHEAVGH